MSSFIPNLILLSIFIFILLYSTYYRVMIDQLKWGKYKIWDKVLASIISGSNILIVIFILLFLFEVLPASFTMICIMFLLISAFLCRGVWWRLEYLEYVKHSKKVSIMDNIYKKVMGR